MGECMNYGVKLTLYQIKVGASKRDCIKMYIGVTTDSSDIHLV